jgi:hypothetical protein
MEEKRDIVDEASRYASARVPLPQQPPIQIAALAGVATFLVIIIFKVIAGFGIEDFGVANLATPALIAVIIFGHYWFNEREHYRILDKELDRLQKEDIRRAEILQKYEKGYHQDSPSEPSQARSENQISSAAKFTSEKVARNSPCPCGSGKKYKHCHGVLNEPSPEK